MYYASGFSAWQSLVWGSKTLFVSFRFVSHGTRSYYLLYWGSRLGREEPLMLFFLLCSAHVFTRYLFVGWLGGCFTTLLIHARLCLYFMESRRWLFGSIPQRFYVMLFTFYLRLGGVFVS